MQQTPEQIVLQGTAFWTNLAGREPTANEANITVVLPVDQTLMPDSLRAIMGRINDGVQP